MNFVGREFFFGIPLSPDDGASISLEVTVGTPSQQADFVVESIEGEIASGTANSGSPVVISLNDTFQVTESGEVDQNMKGIKVCATDLIYILVALKYHNFSSLIDYGSYFVHPNIEYPGGEGYVYYAVSAHQETLDVMDQHSNILLVGNHNDTFISITPTQTIRLPAEDAQNDSALVDEI